MIQMDSVFLKAALAVDSDPWFLMRLKVACEMAGVEYTRRMGIAVAAACAEQISVTDEMTVDTSQVTDEQISVAVAAYDPEAEVPESELLLTLARMDATLTGFTVALLDSSGREQGAVWVEPTGYHDAYPEGWEVSWDGKLWVSLVSGNVETPGVSGWREVPTDGGVPAWVQPVGYHDAYKMGDLVTHVDHVWESTADSNVWEPGRDGSPWSDLGPIDGYQP